MDVDGVGGCCSAGRGSARDRCRKSGAGSIVRCSTRRCVFCHLCGLARGMWRTQLYLCSILCCYSKVPEVVGIRIHLIVFALARADGVGGRGRGCGRRRRRWFRCGRARCLIFSYTGLALPEEEVAVIFVLAISLACVEPAAFIWGFLLHLEAGC